MNIIPPHHPMMFYQVKTLVQVFKKIFVPYFTKIFLFDFEKLFILLNISGILNPIGYFLFHVTLVWITCP